jgi:ubiquinone/menaquinone biosynthesis C-methylase UbiE
MSQPSYAKSIERVTRSKAQAQANYNNISRWYDLLEGAWETPARNAGLEKLHIRAGETVLEIGVGTGHAAITMAQSVEENGRVYGFDLSSGMLHVTQTRAGKKQLTETITLAQGDAVRLPFVKNSVDAIFMSFVLELFDTPEIPQVLAECRRVLNNRGRVSIVSLSKTGKSTWLRNLYEWSHRRFPQLVDCRPIFVQQALEESGFATMDADLISLWGLPVEISIANNSG